MDAEDHNRAIDHGSCPACGQAIDYCQGHGEIGDPEGFKVLERHDNGNHEFCHPDGCDDVPVPEGM